jgi:hypothetical protein
MRVAPARKELFGQRNGGDVGTRGLAGGVQRTRTGRQNLRAIKRLLHANAGRARKHELMSGLAVAAEGVISGILPQGAAEVGF